MFKIDGRNTKALVDKYLLLIILAFNLLIVVYLLLSSHTYVPILSPSSTAPTLSPSSIGRLEKLERKVKFMRRTIGALYCKQSETGYSGGWCLVKGGDNYFGHNIPYHHVKPDMMISQRLAELYKNQTVLDLGCGIGQYGIYFEKEAPEKNIVWHGYDGAENIEEFTKGYVQFVDLSEPLDGFEMHDWVMSLEVGEHVPAEFTDILIDNQTKFAKKGVIVSWGIPGQGGHSHINLLTNDQVIEKFKARGFEYDKAYSDLIRSEAQHYWFRNTFMKFDKV